MTIISISRRSIKIALLFITAVAAVAGIFCFCRHFCVPAVVKASATIEIFDIARGEVIKQVQPDRVTRREAEKLVKGITGLYLKFKPLPDKGRIIRVPMEPPYRIKNKWLNDCGISNVDMLYVLFPEDGAPYLLILDGRQRPWFFNSAENRYFSHFM